jgi:hypothetical protein
MMENIRLTTEVNDLMRRCETERLKFESNRQELEDQVENLRMKLTSLESGKRTAAEDYERRIDILEKQIKSNKEFVEVSIKLEFCMRVTRIKLYLLMQSSFGILIVDRSRSYLKPVPDCVVFYDLNFFFKIRSSAGDQRRASQRRRLN